MPKTAKPPYTPPAVPSLGVDYADKLAVRMHLLFGTVWPEVRLKDIEILVSFNTDDIKRKRDNPPAYVYVCMTFPGWFRSGRGHAPKEWSSDDMRYDERFFKAKLQSGGWKFDAVRNALVSNDEVMIREFSRNYVTGLVNSSFGKLICAARGIEAKLP